jgi:hypothetical protein
MEITLPDHLDLNRQFAARKRGISLAGQLARRLLCLVVNDNKKVDVTVRTLLTASIGTEKVDGARRNTTRDGPRRLRQHTLEAYRSATSFPGCRLHCYPAFIGQASSLSKRPLAPSQARQE